MKNLKNKKAFTMVELLVSMAIIGLLITTAIWGIGLAQQSARNTQRRTAGSNIVAGFAEFYARFNIQPNIATFSGNTITLTNNTVTPNKSYVMGGFTGINTPIAVAGSENADALSATNGNCTGYGTNTTQTKYITGYITGKGMRVCVCLEGGSDGSANLSANPSTITCP